MAISLGLLPGNERKYGLDCAGVVVQVGKAVTSFSVGDKVATAMKDGGCFSNRLTTPSNMCHKIPAGVTFEVCFPTFKYRQSLINDAGGCHNTNLLCNSAICPGRFSICKGWTSK